ncbi:uncharacterized protein LOC127100532 [Lathyrus oleraceus]|uniref:uncharacterized protein LOC127100532 n=1 Tax=Pisum sativum TaxID=3888 RepID=UPI0021D29B5E|nr:uncharacterized protein LOC127100532 [Pisum sativum]
MTIPVAATPQPQQQSQYQRQQNSPRRNYNLPRQPRPEKVFDPIPMSYSQVLQHLLKLKLVNLRNRLAPFERLPANYNPNARCEFHSGGVGHDVENLFALKYATQNLLDSKSIQFTQDNGPNLPFVKEYLVKDDVYPGCVPECIKCKSQPEGCDDLKAGIQSLITEGFLQFDRIGKDKKIEKSSEKAVTWKYGSDVYYHGINVPQQRAVPSASSSQEVEELLRIIRKSDYKVVDHLSHTPSKISILYLLLCSETHRNDLVKLLCYAFVPQDITINQLEGVVDSISADNGLGFTDVDLPPEGRNHKKALHISMECKGTTLSCVLVDTLSSLNMLPKSTLMKIDYVGVELRPSDLIVKAFDGYRRAVFGEVDLPVKI